MPALRRPALAGLFLVLAANLAPADPTSDKQKAAAKENLAKAEVKATVVESANLIFCSPLPETRAKAVAEALEKTLKVARKGLQYDPKDEPWTGKLTVYFLPERKDYGLFVRLFAGQRPDATFQIMVGGDEPFVVCGTDLPAKATDADVAAELAPRVGAALLQAKAGATTVVPPWVRDGYGRAAALRAEGPNGKRFPGYKSQARAAVLGGKGKGQAPISEVWEGNRPDSDLLATSLMDYLAFGSDKAGMERFPRFVSALKPDENGDSPPAAMALETVGWKAPELDLAWKKWVQAGMVAK